MILTGRQFREGRLLADMEQADLARDAGGALALVVRVVAVDGMAMMKKSDAATVRSALQAAGVDYTPEGPRLRKANKSETN